MVEVDTTSARTTHVAVLLQFTSTLESFSFALLSERWVLPAGDCMYAWCGQRYGNLIALRTHLPATPHLQQ